MDYKNELGNWEEIILEPSGDTLPVGSIAQFGGKTAPTNWLFCNGQAVSRETYAELFSVIGTTYGDGDGSTTFNVPDFIGRVPVGLDEEDTDFDTLGETGGEKEHTLTVNEMPSHNHYLAPAVRAYTAGGSYQFPNTGSPNDAIEINKTSNTGGNKPHNIMQPYTVTNFIIKAKQSVGLVGNVVSDMNAQGDNDVAPTKVIKEYVDKSIITAYLTTPIITTTDGFIKCQLDSSTSFGNKLTLENGALTSSVQNSEIVIPATALGPVRNEDDATAKFISKQVILDSDSFSTA